MSLLKLSLILTIFASLPTVLAMNNQNSDEFFIKKLLNEIEEEQREAAIRNLRDRMENYYNVTKEINKKNQQILEKFSIADDPNEQTDLSQKLYKRRRIGAKIKKDKAKIEKDTSKLYERKVILDNSGSIVTADYLKTIEQHPPITTVE